MCKRVGSLPWADLLRGACARRGRSGRAGVHVRRPQLGLPAPPRSASGLKAVDASLARLEGRDDPTSWVAFRRASRGSAMKLQVMLVLVVAAASLAAAQESDGEAGCSWAALGRRLLPPNPSVQRRQVTWWRAPPSVGPATAPACRGILPLPPPRAVPYARARGLRPLSHTRCSLQPTCCCPCPTLVPRTGTMPRLAWQERHGLPARRRAAAGPRSRGSA